VKPAVHRLLSLAALPTAACVSPAEPPAEPIPVPFVVSEYYSPDGFFGDGETRGRVKLEKSCPDRPPGARGDCYTITYTPGVRRFAGIFWQHPHNNWGDRPGHRVTPGATKITFQARAAKAGQGLSAGAGQMRSMPLHDNFELEEVSVALGETWAPHEIPFRGMEYQGESGVIGAFMVSLRAGDGDAPITFYLDDIRWTP
jgi:hypothetical protein